MSGDPHFSPFAENNPLHIPVLKNEVLEVFSSHAMTNFLDLTLGLGGHALAILENHPEIEHYFAFDLDAQAIEQAQLRLKDLCVFLHCFQAHFSQAGSYLPQQKTWKVDGILADLGVCSMQLDTASRGFSFMRQGPLDMRMDRRQSLSAQEIVNRWTEEELERIFREYGEEPRSRQAAKAIVEARKKRNIETTYQLTEVLKGVVFSKRGKIHPVTLVFQALRIAVNNELEPLEKAIENLAALLHVGASIAIITFHRLEDRIVKQTFKKLSGRMTDENYGQIPVEKKKKPALFELMTKKPIVPSVQECRFNPRAASAKMRVLKKVR